MNKQPEVRARTRERIVEAFFSLYEGRALREVTVGEVAAAAHVNRSTFYEYFDGDTGVGLGATHQTGWTGLVAHLHNPRLPMEPPGVVPPARD